MGSKSQRKIDSKTARDKLTWNNYIFRTQLITKTRKCPNYRINICGKEYISKACSGYESLHPTTLEGQKVFKRPQCNQKPDRDFNAAMGILFKNMNLVFGSEVDYLLLDFLGILQSFDQEQSSLKCGAWQAIHAFSFYGTWNIDYMT